MPLDRFAWHSDEEAVILLYNHFPHAAVGLADDVDAALRSRSAETVKAETDLVEA